MHYSVLYQESIDALSIKPDGLYVDGTFGRGGHAQGILEQLSDQGRLLAFDKDIAAHEFAAEKFEGESRLQLCHESFAGLKALIAEEGLLGKVDGVLLDLGVSSPQLDEAERGFSFLRDGDLDMRMDQTSGVSAKEFIAEADVSELSRVFHVFGEEKFARLIASRIVERREVEPFETTLQLADFIEQVVPKKAQKSGGKTKHPATRVFQAIRIHVNRELGDLADFLDGVVDVLAVGGRLAVISFHSLEDRMVKRFIKSEEQGPKLPRHIPVSTIARPEHLASVGKAIKAGESELEENIRSRSAVLRIAEKMPAVEGVVV